MVTSDARRMLVRPPSSGIILPPGRVLLTSNGPATLVPGVTGRPAISTSSGVLLTVAPPAVTAHRPEKRKYDTLRYDHVMLWLRVCFTSVCVRACVKNV